MARDQKHRANGTVNAIPVWEGMGYGEASQTLLPGGFWKDHRNNDGEIWKETKGTFQRTLEVIFFLPARKE